MATDKLTDYKQLLVLQKMFVVDPGTSQHQSNNATVNMHKDIYPPKLKKC
jgi:hypothetical protein